MRKKFLLAMLVCTITLLPGCGKATETIDKESVVEQDVSLEESTKPEASSEEVSLEDSSEISEASVEGSSEDVVIEQEVADVPLYDRTYLDKEDGGYIYRLADPNIIARYDELYADAFTSVVTSHDERMKWFNSGFSSRQQGNFGDLVFRKTDANQVISTGSDFEMDYNFDLNNVGYTYVDLDSDGTFELIFGVLSDRYNDGLPMENFERAFALIDNKVVKIFDGGCRMYYWLGYDGHIYETGSGGAAFGGTWRVHFDESEVPDEDIDWGSNGFKEDEFVGVWNVPVHITGNLEDIDDLAVLPENHITYEEWDAMEAEWKSRRVKIDWLRMADYLAKH
ncbi:MAG: hypothetical protein J6N21_19425 [Butyrivibrio sp.]|nr:hypothetical protein [Butyrivibrio sp.]